MTGERGGVGCGRVLGGGPVVWGGRAERRGSRRSGPGLRVRAVALITGALAACSGAAGPGAGGPSPDGGDAPVGDPVPAVRECAGPPLPALSTRSTVIESAAVLGAPHNVYDWSSFADANLGIGHLALDFPSDGEPVDDRYYTWPQHIVYPLFDAPAGEHIGWFDRGWVVLGFGYDALHRQGSGAGHVETAYEQLTLIVYEATPDGWYRIRHTEPRSGEPGTAWVHACHVKGSPVSLTFESWEDRFRDLEDTPFFYRSSVRHSLRAGPSTDFERIAWIPAASSAYEIRILEIAGDWMQVAVQQPSTYCQSDDDVVATVQEGWIKWRDEEKGPWVWWHTRGC